MGNVRAAGSRRRYFRGSLLIRAASESCRTAAGMNEKRLLCSGTAFPGCVQCRLAYFDVRREARPQTDRERRAAAPPRSRVRSTPATGGPAVFAFDCDRAVDAVESSIEFDSTRMAGRVVRLIARRCSAMRGYCPLFGNASNLTARLFRYSIRLGRIFETAVSERACRTSHVARRDASIRGA